MNYKIILKIIIGLTFIFADPYKQLDINFLKNKKNNNKIPIKILYALWALNYSVNLLK